jgi:hypothetical protein
MDTHFSGHPLLKTSSLGGALAMGAFAGLAALPPAYILNAYNRKAQYETGQNLFPGSSISPVSAAQIVGGGTALGTLLGEKYSKDLISKVKVLK